MRTVNCGFLLSVEGIDGSGKSTFAKNVQTFLKSQNFSTVLTCEPGDTLIGKQLRDLLQKKPVPMCDQTEYLLYAADRAQHFTDVVIPNLQQNKIVISDRMADSSIAYNGYGRGLDLNMIRSINDWVMQRIKPNLTVYLQISIDTAIERLKKRNTAPSAMEQEKEAFTKKVIQGFETIFANRDNVIILDGELDEKSVLKNAQEKILKKLL